jgi:hypothetical protein
LEAILALRILGGEQGIFLNEVCAPLCGGWMTSLFQTLQEQLQHTLCSHNSFSEQQSTLRVAES